MVLSKEDKNQLNELAKNNTLTDEQIQQGLASSNSLVQERTRFYLQRRNYFESSFIDKVKMGGEYVGDKYNKVKETLSPYAQQLSQAGNQVQRFAGGKGSIQRRKRAVNNTNTIQGLSKQINVNPYTSIQKTNIKANMNLVKPARMNQQSFNSVLYDGVRKFNDGFHSSRFTRQNVWTDKPLSVDKYKQNMNILTRRPGQTYKEQRNFGNVKSSTQTKPVMSEFLKVNYMIPNQKYNRSNLRKKYYGKF